MEKIKILLVGDQLVYAKLVEVFLNGTTQYEFDFTHILSLSAYFKTIDKDNYDVVLLDLYLKDSEGIETLERFFEISPDASVIVLADNENESVVVKAIQKGAQDLINKNQLNTATLVKAIVYANERRKLKIALANSNQQLKEVKDLLKSKDKFQCGQFHIKTQRTARCFSLGNLNEATENVWIVLHGYGFHAKYFLNKFEPIATPDNYIVAPEGLSRFYKEGFTGKVGASWMTKEDRLAEIEDYIVYLNNLYNHIFIKINRSEVRLITVGFSQGGATLVRWLNNRKAKTDHLVLWGTKIPDDFDFENDKDLFDNTSCYGMIGKEDEFLSYFNIDEYQPLLHKYQITFDYYWYDGGHDIVPRALLHLQQWVTK